MSKETNLRDTLLVHSSVKHGPGYSSRVLALEEQGFGLAILESENLAVTADVELALSSSMDVSNVLLPSLDASMCAFQKISGTLFHERCGVDDCFLEHLTDLARVDLGGAEGIVVGTHLGRLMLYLVVKWWLLGFELMPQSLMSGSMARLVNCGLGNAKTHG